MLQGYQTDSDSRRAQGADASDPDQGRRPANVVTTARAGGGIAQPSDIRLGTLGVGLLALLMGAQVLNQMLKGERD